MSDTAYRATQLVLDSAENFQAIYGGIHGQEAVQQFTEALRDANSEWHPGSDVWHDSIEEVAEYLLAGDDQRAVALARTILRKWRARRGLPALADDVDIAAAADDADDAADDDPAAPLPSPVTPPPSPPPPPPSPVTPPERSARPVFLTARQKAQRARRAAEALARQNPPA